MPKYKLSRRFYDGERVHPVDAILDFKEGTQPRTAKRVEAKAKEKEVEYEEVDDDDEPLLDPAPNGVEDAKPGDTLSSLSKKGK